MAPKLSEDEIDDLIYFTRAGEVADLNETLTTLSSRETVSPAEILLAARDEGKSTCLHMAAGNGNLEIVKILVEHFSGRPKDEKQTFLDAPNEFANTGMHWAAMSGHLDVVQYLVSQGASPALPNDKDYIPLDLARLSEKTSVVDYFLSQLEQLESKNETEGLESGAASMDLGGEAAAEEAEDKAEETKPTSNSS